MTFPIFVCRKSGKFEHCRNRLLRSFKRHCHRRRKLFLLQRTKLIITPILSRTGYRTSRYDFLSAAHHLYWYENGRRNVCRFLLLLMHFRFSGRTAKDEISQTVSTFFPGRGQCRTGFRTGHSGSRQSAGSAHPGRAAAVHPALYSGLQCQRDRSAAQSPARHGPQPPCPDTPSPQN